MEIELRSFWGALEEEKPSSERVRTEKLVFETPLRPYAFFRFCFGPKTVRKGSQKRAGSGKVFGKVKSWISMTLSRNLVVFLLAEVYKKEPRQSKKDPQISEKGRWNAQSA